MATISAVTKEEAAERVARGVARLDAHRPEWRRRLSFSMLDMESPTLCILGQVFGTYDSGLYALAIESFAQATECGFAATPGLQHYWLSTEYLRLTDAWSLAARGHL
jgi:hypothetical protein